jgi:hypothetical protein
MVQEKIAKEYGQSSPAFCTLAGNFGNLNCRGATSGRNYSSIFIELSSIGL